MNIKNAEAYALAKELAALEETTMTQVVINALRARQGKLTQADPASIATTAPSV